MLRSLIIVSIQISLAAVGCNLVGANKATTHKKKPVSAASARASAVPSASAHSDHAAATAPVGSGSAAPNTGKPRYALPFAWENSDNEPLARTREFAKDLLRDNQEYMKRGPKFFEAFAKAQHPRSTVVTCADSRVQNAAWDVTPENDDFTIRNIGNQLETSAGSVEYGVEHLGTAVLLIVGHTGCGAIKAAMSDKTDLSPTVRHEIDSIALPNEFIGQSSDAAWAQAVVANVHAQVKTGLDHFGRYVAEGRLTVIGTVYDFRNDLGKGAGRLTIVNVNGNAETPRLEAFVQAVTGGSKGARSDSAPTTATSLDTTRSAEQIAKTIEDLPGLNVDHPQSEH